MNEQKDKLLINLVEPGRIGRTPFNSFFSLSSLFRMGELVKKKRIDGGCGGSGNEAWLGWIVFWWVIGGGSRRQPAKREDEQAKRNVFLLFHLHQLWMKRIIDWEMEWRDEIEEQTKPTHSLRKEMNLRNEWSKEFLSAASSIKIKDFVCRWNWLWLICPAALSLLSLIPPLACLYFSSFSSSLFVD